MLLELCLLRFGIHLRRSRQTVVVAWDLSSPFRCCRRSSSSAAFFAVLYHYRRSCSSSFAIGRLGHDHASWAPAAPNRSIVAASIFMGQTEAPLTIRPFLPELTHSELMTVMTSGMAHVSGSSWRPTFAFGADPKHLLSAVIMTAPGTLLIAKMLVPETEQPKTAGRVVMSEAEHGEGIRKSARRDCPGHGRWLAPGAEHWRHADRVSCAGALCSMA